MLGLEGLRDLVRSVAVPALAIGGVTTDKVRDIAATGAAGVAAIGLFADVPTDVNDADLDRTLRALVVRLRAPFQHEAAVR
jgi:thiamine monophosphate synthase